MQCLTFCTGDSFGKVFMLIQATEVLPKSCNFVRGKNEWDFNF